jgi:UDP-2,3-diacylglucosamine pyrophosphatase LpxH
MKNLISLILFLALPLISTSQGIDNDDFMVTHGPYLQNLSENSVTIIWTTNKPAVPGVSISDPDGKKRFVRNSHEGIIDGGGTLHKVRVDGLEPGKTYKYNINSVQILKYQAYKIYYGDTLVLKSTSITTPSLNADEVTFTVINDVHELSGKMASYLRNGSKPEKDICFFNGDMVNYLQDPEQLFAGFIDTATTYFASGKPFIYIRGNHETRGFMARTLKAHFDYKDDSFYFSFNRGPVHFIVLDCGEDKPDNNMYYYGLADYDSYRMKELEWLKNEIKSESFRNSKYRIVMVHMPIIRDEKAGYGMRFLADHYGPVLKSAGISLMISGHTHRNTFYEQSKAGFGYPVLVNSNNSFVEVKADNKGIKAVVKDVTGKIIGDYDIK